MNYLVYDIGGTYIKYGVMDDNRELLSRGKIATPKTSIHEFTEVVKAIFESVSDGIRGIAISMPGRIDVYSGYAFTAGLLGYLDQTNIAALFHSFTDLPVSIENDGKCAALAESWVGALEHVYCGVVLVFGSGVGGGLIVDKKLHRGFNNIAGEFSFVRQGDDNLFGQLGSVVTLLHKVEKIKTFEKDTLTGERLFELIKEGDTEVLSELQKFCDLVAYNLYNLQYILDPEVFAIGGGISEQEIFIEQIKASINRLKEKNQYQLTTPKIVQCKYRNDANLIGAMMNFHLNKIMKIS